MKKILIIIILLFTVNFAFGSEETLILFDTSVSMASDINGISKHEMATEATKQILSNIPLSKSIGLRIIGIRLSDSANMLNLLVNPEVFCQATELLEPIKTNNMENIKKSLDTLMPLGTTPLIYSLNEAIKSDFNSQNRNIILITDGIDECGGDLCSYIRELLKQNIRVTINVIALGVNNEELSQLKCLTDGTNGKIIRVDTIEDIKIAYKAIFTAQNNPKVIQQNIQVSNRNINHTINKAKSNIEYKKNNSESRVKYKNFLIEIN